MSPLRIWPGGRGPVPASAVTASGVVDLDEVSYDARRVWDLLPPSRHVEIARQLDSWETEAARGRAERHARLRRPLLADQIRRAEHLADLDVRVGHANERRSGKQNGRRNGARHDVEEWEAHESTDGTWTTRRVG